MSGGGGGGGARCVVDGARKDGGPIADGWLRLELAEAVAERTL